MPHRALSRSQRTWQLVRAQQHNATSPVRERCRRRVRHRSGTCDQRGSRVARLEQQQRSHPVQPGVARVLRQGAVQQRKSLGKSGVGNEFAKPGADHGFVKL